MKSRRRSSPTGLGNSKLLTAILCLLGILFIPGSTKIQAQALSCAPAVLQDLEFNDQNGEARTPMMRSGPFTYIMADPDEDAARFGDDMVKSFAVDFTRAATIHLQMWKRSNGNGIAAERTFTLVHDQILSVSEAGVQDVEVNWDLRDGSVWGFSYDGDDEVPIAFYSDSRIRAMSEEMFIGGSPRLNEENMFSQDAPQSFRIQICTEKSQIQTRSSGSSYTCERRSTWDIATDNVVGPITYIHGKKISTPTAVLKDVEVSMVDSNFITIQVWRKDVSNYEFLLVKERSYYASAGYNLLPTNLDLQYGDQWGFTFSGPGSSIFSVNTTSDSSYVFTETITGVGSKRSYAAISPTNMDFKISTCIETGGSPMGGSAQGYYAPGQQQNYYQQPYGNNYNQYNTPYGNNWQQPYGNNYQSNAQLTVGGQANVPYVPNANGIVYPQNYNPYGGANSPFYPQASPTKCYCFDNGFWYSATNNATGPLTHIDSTAFTEMNANIEAFEIQALDDTEAERPNQMITLQIWRPSGYGQNALSLVWEKEVSIRPGYQRINLAYSVMAGDRFGFVYNGQGNIPIPYYTDTSQIGHEFNYPVSASTGQQIYLSSAQVSYKKFTIRPCLCSFANGVIPLSNGFPYYQAPATTQQGINAATSFLSGSGFNGQVNIPQQQPQMPMPAPAPTTQATSGNNFGLNYGYNSQAQSTNSMYQSTSSGQNCFGQVGAPGYLEVTGPFTYINFRKLPTGRINYVEIDSRNQGTVSFQLWRYDSGSGQFQIIYEKPVALYQGPNRVTVETDTTDGDLMGFSYMGNGVCPIRYSPASNSNGYEEYASYSQYSGSNSIAPPQMFSNKVFNIKACMFTTSFNAAQQNFLGGNTNNNGYAFNSNSQMQANGGLNYGSNSGMNNLVGASSGYNAYGYGNSQNFANQNYVNSPLYSGNSQATPSGGQINDNILSLITSYFGGQSTGANYMGASGQMNSQGANNFNQQQGMNGAAKCVSDGEAPGPFDNSIAGPYTFVGDFGDLSGKCVQSIQYMSSRVQSQVVFFRAKPSASGFTIEEEAMSMSVSTIEPTTVTVDWCLDSSDRIGFYYDGQGDVPIMFTYYWGQASELPQEMPMNGMIPALFDTSKSFDIKVCCSYNQDQNMGQNSMNNMGNNYGYNQQQQTMTPPSSPSSYGNNWQSQQQQQMPQNNYMNTPSTGYSSTGYNSNNNANIYVSQMGGQPPMNNQQQNNAYQGFASSNLGNNYGYNAQMNYNTNQNYATQNQRPVMNSNNGGNYGMNAGFNAGYSQQQYGQTPYAPTSYGNNPINSQAANNYQYQNGYSNNAPGYNAAQNGYNYYPSASGSYNAGYNYQRQQRGYSNFGGYNVPVLNQQPYNFFPPNCVGSSIDTQISIKGHPGPLVYFVEAPFNRPGRVSHVELEAFQPETLTIVLVNAGQNGQVNIKYSTQVNVFPGINRIPQQFVDWSVQPGDMIGFISSQQVSTVTYTVNAQNKAIMNFNACLEDRMYNSPTTYNNPNPAGGLITQGGLYNSNDMCSCFDNAHWPYAFEQDYGPLMYINGEDFRQLTGFIQAFEIEASTFGEITLYLWRRASPTSDRLTHVWQQTIQLTAGYQRIDGITANILDGDMWGFSYDGAGVAPVNFLTDTNYFGYEIKGQYLQGLVGSQSTIYLSSANMAFKRFKIRPCVCRYSTPGSNYIPQSGGLAYPVSNPVAPITGNTFTPNAPNYYNSPQQGYNPQPMSAPQPSGGYQNQNGYGQVAATAPSYPTDNYQFCYGQLGAQGTQTKFGPYLYINFEPLPAGTIEFIEFEATYPSNITWQIWRQQPTGKFAVVYEKSTTFQTGKHSVQLMEDTEERDLVGFYYEGTDQIPIKFSKFIGEQSYEDFSGTAPTLGYEIDAPTVLIDQLFNYKLCMYSVANSQPIQTSSGIGGYGNNYMSQTPAYYQSGTYGQTPGFGPAPYPVPGYSYNNLYYPDPTYGISAYNPVQPYYYDNYFPNAQNNYNTYSPSYGASTTYQTNTQQYPISPNQNYGQNYYGGSNYYY